MFLNYADHIILSSLYSCFLASYSWLQNNFKLPLDICKTSLFRPVGFLRRDHFLGRFCAYGCCPCRLVSLIRWATAGPSYLDAPRYVFRSQALFFRICCVLLCVVVPVDWGTSVHAHTSEKKYWGHWVTLQVLGTPGHTSNAGDSGSHVKF